MLPERVAFPPADIANVEPQIEQAIEFAALSNIMVSCPQSVQLTRMNLPLIIIPQLFIN